VTRAPIGLLVLVWAACSTPTRPAPPTEAELSALCPDAVMVDHTACLKLGELLVQEGRYRESLPALEKACPEYKDACVSIGIMLLQGRPDIEVDRDLAWEFMGRATAGINSDYEGKAWLVMRDLADPNQTWAIRRVLIEDRMDNACRRGHSGWPCFNYGVALTCGFLGEPDVKHARNVLQRGCRLGDGRACDLFSQLDTMAPTLPTCDLIGPDPDVPVKLELHVEPIPEGPIPDTVKPFARKLMP